MASVAHVADLNTTQNGTSYDIGPFTPTEDDLLVVYVAGIATRATGSLSSSVAGQTFTLVASGDYGGSSRFYCYVADQLATAESQTLTFDCTGDTSIGAMASVEGVTGVTRVGLNAIRQFDIQELQTDVAPETVFDAAVLTGNPTVGGVTNGKTTGVAEPVGWTELFEVQHVDVAAELETVARNSGFTGTTITWDYVDSTIFAVASVEVDSSAESAVAAHRPLMLMGVG